MGKTAKWTLERSYGRIPGRRNSEGIYGAIWERIEERFAKKSVTKIVKYSLVEFKKKCLDFFLKQNLVKFLKEFWISCMLVQILKKNHETFFERILGGISEEIQGRFSGIIIWVVCEGNRGRLSEGIYGKIYKWKCREFS